MSADPREKLHYDPKQKCCSDAAIGDMFPDLLKLDLNTFNRGRVFSVYIQAAGLGVQERSVLVQDQTGSCRDPQRRGLVDHQSATPLAPDLGIPLSRPADQYDEQ